jgi:cytosol alanyl aminopeptidase
VLAVVNVIRNSWVPGATEARPSYTRFIRKVLGARARQLGWTPRPNEAEDLTQIRPELVQLVAGVGGDSELAHEAVRLAQAWLKDRTAVHPTMVSAVLEAAAYNGDERLLDEFLSAIPAIRERADREKLIRAVARFNNPALAMKALDWMLTSGFDPNETQFLLFQFMSGHATQVVPWRFATAHFERLVRWMPATGNFDPAAALMQTAGPLCWSGEQEQFERFFKEG